MSSAKSKAISEIDLEEFERRLGVVRAPATLPNRAAAIAAATQDEEAPAHEYFAQAPLQAGDRINFARPPRRGSWYLKVAGLTAVALLMVGFALRRARCLENLDGQAFIPEETFVSRDQQWQIVYGVHHRNSNGLQRGGGSAHLADSPLR